jgi:8-oxo-dGTP pyrophosphatase MutT (NUDIX family)
MEPETSKRKKTTSCGGVVYKVLDDRIYFLLVRPFKDRDSWGVPKGHIDVGETIETCALREVYEETGIVVKLEKQLPDVSTKFKNEHKTVMTFLAQQVCDSMPRPQDGENVEVKWFAADELPTVHIYQRPLLANAVTAIKEMTSGNPA